MQNFIDSKLKVFLILFFVGFAAYSSMLEAPFKTMDDQFSIVKNEDIKSFENLPTLFTSSFFKGNAYYRPLVSLSFLLEYHLFKENPFFYNLTNLLLHILVSFLIFLIGEKIIKNRSLSFLSAALFVFHPINWEPVCNIPGRSILMCSFFVLLAFYFYLRAKEGERPLGPNFFSAIFFVCALLSKESAIMFPALVVWYEIVFNEGSKINLKGVVKSVGVFVLISGIYLLIRRGLGITEFFYWRTPWENLLGVLTFLRSTLTFFRLFILPVDLHFDRSAALWDHFVNFNLLWVFVFYSFLTFAVMKNYQKIPRACLFFGGWFFIELFPVSQVIASIGVQAGYISIAEHFLYLASTGVFVIMIVGLSHYFNKFKKGHVEVSNILSFNTAVFFVLLFSITIQQSLHAQSEDAMFQRTLQEAPHNVRVRNSLALNYARKRDFENAQTHFSKVLDADPFNARARIGLGKSLCDQGRYLECIDEYEKVVNPGSLKNLLKDNLRLSLQIVIGKYKARLEKEPNNADLFYSLGIIYAKLGETPKAVVQYNSAIALNPEHKNALFNLGLIMIAQDNLPAAREFLKRALEIESPDQEINRRIQEALRRIQRQ